MTELEKAIKGLECCILKDPDDKHRCDVCPYNPSNYDEISNSPCVNGLKAKALDLLKAQVPRVLAFEEVSNLPDRSPIFCEEKNPKFESEWELYMTEYDDRKYDECYGREYRYWTSRPSEQQMRDTPWEGEME